MSDPHSAAQYSLEISGGEVIVRDHEGTVVGTIALEEIGGAFSLPDGTAVDLAALMPFPQPDLLEFDPPAGAANENDPGVVDRSAGGEPIDTTGHGAHVIALSIADVLDMTDGSHHLTVVGDKGDVVTLSGDSSGHHWSVAGSNGGFTTYVWSDPVHQAVVEISNQLTASVSS